MRKRAKMRLAVLGGMIAGAVAGCWLLDVLEAAANWMLVHWMGLDIGKAAARAPALSGLLLCGLFGAAGPAESAVRQDQPQPCPHGRAGLLD